MLQIWSKISPVIVLLTLVAIHFARVEAGDPRADALSSEVWRREHRIIDMHMHIEGKSERFERAIGIMDAVGIGLGIELGSGTVTASSEELSEFEKVKAIGDEICPGRFLHYAILDYSGWDDVDWSTQAVRQIEKAHCLGAAGLKEFKRLGLVLRNGKGKLIKVDDPQLDPVWRRCGELGMPVSIHVGDPQAFWEPLDATNERWEELRDHPNWWFGDFSKHPPRMELLKALERVITRHPKTTFVCVHFANNPEDIDWVDRQLVLHPNMMADIAARIPEIGRHDSDKLRSLFVKHQDRILFGTDFQVWSRIILGSAGDHEKPTDHDAVVFFQKCYRFFETANRDWRHMTPIQGDWTISSIDLPPAVQRKVYFDNARKLLARSFPRPTFYATKIANDFSLDGKLDDSVWRSAKPVRIEYGLLKCVAHPELSTTVRALWSDQYLYLAYEAPFTELSMAQPASTEERLGLWNDDVVELFVGTESEDENAYYEFEWAPNGEKLDARMNLPDKNFNWQSKMESVTTIDSAAKVYRVEARIPLASMTKAKPVVGAKWRANLYRKDVANKVFLAWSPTLTNTAHTPQRFGWLELVDETTAD